MGSVPVSVTTNELSAGAPEASMILTTSTMTPSARQTLEVFATSGGPDCDFTVTFVPI